MSTATAQRTCCKHDIPQGPWDGDTICCLCTRRPCDGVSLDRAVMHAQLWRAVRRRTQLKAQAYYREHGHEPLDPWANLPCPDSCLTRQ